MDEIKRRLVDLLADSIARQTETTNVEFKSGKGGVPNELWKTISAFAHTPEGGVIFFGVVENDDRSLTIEGGLNLASLQEEVSNYFSTLMVNALPPELYIIDHEEKELLAVIVKPTPDDRRPCFYSRKGLSGGACVRVGNTNKVLSEEEIKRLIRDSGPFRYDRSLLPDTTPSDLSVEKVRKYIQESATKSGRAPNFALGASQEILKTIGVLALREDKSLGVTVGGYLIFSEANPQTKPEFARCQVRCVRYSGSSAATPVTDQVDINGTLDQQIDEAVKFVRRNIPLRVEIIGAKRVETYAYPENAIRELVANAVIHRDYQMTQGYTRIVIFSNRIEISSPGSLPPGINVENIKSNQFSRNEVIALGLRDLGYMEEFGQGMDIVYSRMREWNLPEPILMDNGNSFQVTLLGRRFSELNERQIKTWKALYNKETTRITAGEYEREFSISRGAATTDLRGMVEAHFLQRIGTGPTTYYELNI